MGFPNQMILFIVHVRYVIVLEVNHDVTMLFAGPTERIFPTWGVVDEAGRGGAPVKTRLFIDICAISFIYKP